MSSQCFFCIFLCVYVFQFICCVNPGNSDVLGQYKTSIVSIVDCSNPSKPYMKNPPVVYAPTIQNGTLSGSFTVLRDTKNMKIKLKGFVMRNGKWESSHLINNLDCHGIVLHLMCAAMNIKYDRKTCVFFKGFYPFDKLDVNQILHLWVSKVQYGQTLWRSETYTQAGTFSCKEYDMMTEAV